MKRISLTLGIASFMLMVLIVGLALAGSPTTPSIDGTITADGTDWDADELVVDDPMDDSPWGSTNELDNLYTTWDEDNLYVGVSYTIDNNAMVVYVDTGIAGGETDFNSGRGWTGAYPRNITFTADTDIDLMLARWDVNAPQVYTVTDNSGSADLSGSASVGYTNNEVEFGIPWSLIGRPYSDTICMATVLAGGDDHGAADSMPDNPSTDGDEGPDAITNTYCFDYHPYQGELVINELDADTSSTEADEFLELYDGGHGHTVLDGLVVVLYNGSNDEVYGAFDLDGYTTDADGYFVIGGTNVAEANIVVSSSYWLQNGEDAAALYWGDASDFPTGSAVTTDNLVDAIVYDTNDDDDPALLVLLNSGQPQVNEYAEGAAYMHSNQRCPNGSGGQRNTVSYIQDLPTPGASNYCYPDLGVDKTGPQMAPPESTIAYTISYENNGTIDAYDVVITDSLPADVHYVTDTSGLTCPACTMGASGTLTWSVGTMAPGDSFSFDLTAWVTPTITLYDTATNTVSIGTSSTEMITDDNTADWGTYISLLDLVVDKAGPGIGVIGEDLVYHITLENQGVITADDTILTDTLPISTTFAGESNDCGATTTALPGATGPITWSVGDVLSATTCTFHVTATVDTGVAGGTTLINEVEVGTTTPGDDPANSTAQWWTDVYPLVTIQEIQEVPDPATDDASPLLGDSVWVEGIVIAGSDVFDDYNSRYYIEDPAGGPWSGLYIYNSGDRPPVQEGDAVRLFGLVDEYNTVTQLDVRNSANGMQHVLSSGNPLPAPEVITTGLYGPGDVATAEAYESVLIQFNGATVTDDDLGFGEWAFDDGTGAAHADDWSNYLTYNPANGDEYVYIRGVGNHSFGDYKLVPRYDADVNLVETEPTITKEAPALVAPGELFTYTITVENDLGYTLNNVVVTEVIPANVTFADPLDGGIEDSGIVTWTATSLASPGSISFRFTVTATTSITQIVNSDYEVAADNFVTPTQGMPVATLVNTAPALRIHHIQGAGHASVLEYQSVEGIHGIVTAIRTGFPAGFYMQDPNPDGDVGTSEAIFVYTGSEPTVNVGDEVLVDGLVSEFRYDETHLSMTRIEEPTVVVSSTGNVLPAPIVLGNGGRIPPSEIIDNDVSGMVETSGTFDPTEDGLDFFESLEAMLVQVNDPIAVSGTSYGDIGVVGDNGANAGDFTPRGGLVVQPDDFNPERILISDGIEDVPTVDTGVAFSGPISGVVDYDDYNGNFNVFTVNPLPVATGGVVSETTSAVGEGMLRVATFNVYNLDPGDSAARFDGLAHQIVDNLGAPDVIGLQEIQDNTGPTDDGVVSASETYTTLIEAIIDAGGPTYDYRDIAPVNNQDGGQPGANIRVGFLFRTDRGLSFVDRAGGDATTPVTATLGAGGVQLSASPGRIDPNNPAFDDGRKSLVGEFTFNGHTFFVVVNHLKSKSQDTGLFGRYQPPILNTEAQRMGQAEAVNHFVDYVLSLDTEARVIVLGDLNDFQFSDPLDTLEGDDLTNLAYTVPITERYSYIYNGNSQALDHILVSDNGFYDAVTHFDIVHVNAEYGYFWARPSDHDPVVADFYLPATDLTGSAKSSSAGAAVMPGDLVTYTITLSNTGGVSATTTVTDVVIAQYSVYDAIDFTESPTNTLTWTGVVTAGETVELQFVAQVDALADLPGGMTSLTNGAWVDDGEGHVIQVTDATPPFVMVHISNLPVIFRDYAH